MTVMTASRKAIGQGNGVTVVWPYAFLIPLVSQLSVVYNNPNRDAIDPTGLGVILAAGVYSVTGIGNVGGGNVTYPLAGAPVAAPVTITILRTVPYTQPSTMQNQGASYPATYEAALDNIEMQVQQLADIVTAVAAGVLPVVPNMQIVDSIAALKTIAIPSSALIYVVRGFAVVGDGGGGFYWWNGNDARADDGGTIIQLNAGGVGRFNKLF